MHIKNVKNNKHEIYDSVIPGRDGAWKNGEGHSRTSEEGWGCVSEAAGGVIIH